MTGETHAHLGENKPVSLPCVSCVTGKTHGRLMGDMGDSRSPFRLGGPARKSGRFSAADAFNFLGLACMLIREPYVDYLAVC